MLNYDKIPSIITYRKVIKGLLQREGEAPTIIQVKPVAQTVGKHCRKHNKIRPTIPQEQ